MVAKYDWEKVKEDYVNKTYKNIKLLADAHNIPYQQVKNKVKQYNNIITKLDDKILDKIADRKAKALERRSEMGKRYLDKANATLDSIEVENASDNAKLAEIGIKLENSGLGIREDDDKSSMIQINLSYPVPLGSETIGNITTKEVIEVKSNDN